MLAPRTARAAWPLRGLRVIDLTQMLAGPYCTMLLADLGADVIKVEPPGGDMTRFSGPFFPEDEERAYGGYFGSINRNKRSIVVDLKTEEGKDVVRRLAASSPVLVENYRAGVMERLGLAWETLHAANPALVYATIRGFGDPRTGESPYVAWPAFDVVAQAMGGVMGITGTADGVPLKAGSRHRRHLPGGAGGARHRCRGAARRAHRRGAAGRRRHGGRRALDVRAHRLPVLVRGGGARARGQRAPHALPVRELPDRGRLDHDRRAGRCALEAPVRRDGAPRARRRRALPHQPRPRAQRAGDAARGRRVDARTLDARRRGGARRQGAGRVRCRRVRDIFADPHAKSRDMLVEVEHAGCDSRKAVYAGTPIKLTATPGGIYRRPPRLGEHTAEILAEFGIDAATEKETRRRR